MVSRLLLQLYLIPKLHSVLARVPLVVLGSYPRLSRPPLASRTLVSLLLLLLLGLWQLLLWSRRSTKLWWCCQLHWPVAVARQLLQTKGILGILGVIMMMVMVMQWQKIALSLQPKWSPLLEPVQELFAQQNSEQPAPAPLAVLLPVKLVVQLAVPVEAPVLPRLRRLIISQT